MLHVFDIYLKSYNIYDSDILSDVILKDFVLYLRRKSIKNTSIHTYMRAIKNLCSWGIYKGYLGSFEYNIKLPRQDPDLILPLSKNEVDHILTYILKYTHDPDNKLLFFRLLLDCGLRSSEALHLKRKDIDLESNIIKINQSKFDKSRMIPLPANVKDLVPDVAGNLFSFDDSGKNSFFTRLKAGSGINRLHAHLLRHTFATSYIVYVGNLEYLRIYMGHSTYNVTQNYIKAAYQCNLLKYDIYKIDDVFS